MKNGHFIRIILFSLLSIGLATQATRWVYVSVMNHALENGVENPLMTNAKIIGLFILCLTYFLMLMLLPLFAKSLVSRLNINRKKLPYMIIGLEVIMLGYAFIFTATFFYTMMLFLVCQPIVLVNGIALYRVFEASEA